MKITDVKTVLLTGPCTNDPFLTECRRHRSAAFIEIHTDVGLVGLGESYNGYRCAELHPAAVNYFAPILMGQAENKPVYELLGGLKHESLPAYATGGPSNYPKEQLAAKIEHYLGLGFRGFKLATGIFTENLDRFTIGPSCGTSLRRRHFPQSSRSSSS